MARKRRAGEVLPDEYESQRALLLQDCEWWQHGFRTRRIRASFLPRIQDFNLRIRKVARVAGNHREIVMQRRRRQQAVDDGK